MSREKVAEHANAKRRTARAKKDDFGNRGHLAAQMSQDQS
jgi:hypothetical protein